MESIHVHTSGRSGSESVTFILWEGHDYFSKLSHVSKCR